MLDMSDNPRDLLRQWAWILDRLRETGVVRSSNNPVADYSEWLSCRALNLEIATKSTKGYDATDVDGTRYEIKGRRLTKENGSLQLSAIRGLRDKHFDWLIGLLFDHDVNLVRAAKIPWDVVNRLSSHTEHTNSATLHLRDQVWEEPGVDDITDRVAAAQPVARCSNINRSAPPRVKRKS